jgi:hypothetical protein
MQYMVRIGFYLMILAFTACNNDKKPEPEVEEDVTVFNYEAFSNRFNKTGLPYQITDTGLLNNTDTSAIRNEAFINYIPDSIKTKLVGKTSKITFVPLVQFRNGNNEHYFVLKAISGHKKAALLAVFDKDQKFSSALPFLIPDTDPKTTQASSVDKSLSISRSVTRKMPDDAIIDGRDVYAYDAGSKNFTLIMTDILDDKNQELINPIDTFSRSHQYAADYVKDKRNMVSIRDSRSANEIQFFIHFERMNGECNGELKGTALMTSSKTAVYRQGGDPCVLEFHFTSNSVRLKEVEGCGSHRGVRCIIEGSFPKKKTPKSTDTKS